MLDGKEVVVRFAPSPTGALHIGGIRTALYNFLLAKKYNGKFLLRIEDTDQKRLVKGAEQYIIDSLNWLGLIPDKGPKSTDEKSEYRQSDRSDIYDKYINILLETGNAYYAFDSPEELESMRERLKLAKVSSPKYNILTRESMKNSLVLTPEKTKDLINCGANYVIRLKTHPKKDIRFQDKVRGWIKFSAEELEDKVLMKSDGTPTYHFANVVDDHLMDISHVIRGEEWLPSTPMHISLYEAFGWSDQIPNFVHLPLLLKAVGEGKLSKRDADQLGFPIFPLSWVAPDSGENIVGFREKGYLPAALLNFLALLGWNPGNNKEVISLDEMVDLFSLEKIGKSGAKFDIKKAIWLNSIYLGKISDEEMAKQVSEKLNGLGLVLESNILLKSVKIFKQRASFLDEIVTSIVDFFWPAIDQDYIEKILISKDCAVLLLTNFLDDLENILSSKELFSNFFKVFAENHSLKIADVMKSFRIALFWVDKGPELYDLTSLITKNDILTRINESLNALEKKSLQ